MPRLRRAMYRDCSMAFRGRAITVDWSSNRITVHAPANADAAAKATGLPFRIAGGSNGRFLSLLVPVTGAGDTLSFLLDSSNLRGTLVMSGPI